MYDRTEFSQKFQDAKEKEVNLVQTGDLAILSNNLNILFENSKLLNEVALRDLLYCLKRLSQDSIGNGSKPKSFFGANRMLETGKFNIHRIFCFWDLILDHFSELAANQNPVIRVLGVDGLTQTIVYAMNAKQFMKSKEFLETLDVLARSPHTETREKCIQTLYQILTAEGEVGEKKFFLMG